MITFTLPLPSAKLCANARTHWRSKAPITKAARELACLTATQARIKHGGIDRVSSIKVTYDKSYTMMGRNKFPAGYRPSDRDNAIGVLKAYLDGIADGLGVNDRDFGPLTLDWGTGNPGVTFEVVV